MTHLSNNSCIKIFSMFSRDRCRQSTFRRKRSAINDFFENGRKVFRKTRNVIRNGEFYGIVNGLLVSSTSIFARFSSTSISFASVLFIDMIIFFSQYLVPSCSFLDVTIHFAGGIRANLSVWSCILCLAVIFDVFFFFVTSEYKSKVLCKWSIWNINNIYRCVFMRKGKTEYENVSFFFEIAEKDCNTYY